MFVLTGLLQSASQTMSCSTKDTKLGIDVAKSALTLALSLRLSTCCRLSKAALQRSTIAERPTWLLLTAANTHNSGDRTLKNNWTT